MFILVLKDKSDDVQQISWKDHNQQRMYPTNKFCLRSESLMHLICALELHYYTAALGDMFAHYHEGTNCGLFRLTVLLQKILTTAPTVV